MGKLIPLLLLTLPALGFTYFWFVLLADLPPPAIDENAYWGQAVKKGAKQDVTIRPFKIAVSDKLLADLKTRLTLETSKDGDRLVPPLEGVGFEYGFNSNYLKTVAKYWLEKYDWKKREALLNKYPSFKTTINGLEIHFQHVKSTNNAKYKATRPLLLVHGWPGSFVEFQKTIPMLIDPKNSDVNFELVIPSLPGYGFSEGSHVPGLGPLEIASIFHKLMKRLGHEKYYAEGGDWGALITPIMASLYPDSVKGLHTTMCTNMGAKGMIKSIIAAPYPTLFMPPEVAKLGYPLGALWAHMVEELGYAHIQATKPDTVGVGLSNSPTGLLAYILEKFSTWTNKDWRSKPDGGLEPHYKMDELLDNIMIYWVTNSITTSQRLYSEGLTTNMMKHEIDRVPVLVPTACLLPPKESFGGQSEWILRDRFKNLQWYKIASKGGHFLAFETPDVFAADVIAFFGSLEKSNAFTKPSPKVEL